MTHYLCHKFMSSLNQRQKVGALAFETDQTPFPPIKHLLTVNRGKKKKKKKRLMDFVFLEEDGANSLV